MNEPAGPADVEYVGIVEVDASGRGVLYISFDLDDLDAAYAELDDRYAAGEGTPYAELLAHQRAFRRASAARDWDAVARLLPDDFTLVSHRRLVGTDAPIGRDEYLATRGAVDDLGVRADLRMDHLLRMSAKAGVSVTTWHGTLDGGDFEDTFLVVYTHDGSRFHSLEIFDLEQLDTALARYEALATAPRAPRVENAATHAVRRIRDALAARDWERFAALFPAAFRNVDRQRMAQLEVDRDRYLDSLRPLFEMTSSPPTVAVLATRGNRLAIVRVVWGGTGRSVGPSEIEWLDVVEVDNDGDLAELVAFDPDDLDAAYTELDRRHAAGEGAACDRVSAAMRAFRSAFAARDWDALAAQFVPGLVVHDRRRLGWETLHGPAAYVTSLRSLVDLAPDARLRLDHVRMSDRGLLWVAAWLGTREGGAFETPWIIVSEHDGLGRVVRFDQYDLDQLDEARARFEELQPDPLRIPQRGASHARSQG